ncbi:hypothetical protein KFU94_01505 [Chloroflexi bacterium TSY]|nr:hypothetical protein [Chloroflexi bacterium TSY]
MQIHIEWGAFKLIYKTPPNGETATPWEILAVVIALASLILQISQM